MSRDLLPPILSIFLTSLLRVPSLEEVGLVGEVTSVLFVAIWTPGRLISCDDID